MSRLTSLGAGEMPAVPVKRGPLYASVRPFCLIVFLIATSTWPAAAQTQTNTQQEAATPAGQVLRLSPEAVEVADQIGVAPLLKRIARLREAPAAADGSSMTLESLTVRQEITEKVLAASLDIDSVNAVIDSEVDQIRGIRADLQARRDKAQNIINIASIFTGGAAGAITSAFQFKPSTVNLGNGIGVAGGAGSVVLSLIGIHTQGGGRRPLGDSPRMLARFLGRQPDAMEAIPSVYPDAVWSYLNSAAPAQPSLSAANSSQSNSGQSNIVTRREQLVAKWRTEGRINQDTSPKSQRRLESISGNISQVRKLNISDLDNRVAMLLDVRAKVSLMKRGLSEIVRALSEDKASLR
jgi:hypothetical protein